MKLQSLFTALIMLWLNALCLFSTSTHGAQATVESVVDIQQLIVREMLPGGSSTAGYLTLTNHGDSKTQLVSVTSEAFERIEIHEHTMNDGMMKMQQVTKDIVITPHQSVNFTSGGYHLMMFGPKLKIKKGITVKVTFNFNNQPSVVADASVISVLDQQKQKQQQNHSHHH